MADIEEKILEGSLAHPRPLGHGRGGIAQHHPAGIGHTFFYVHLLPDMPVVEIHLVGRNVGEGERVAPRREPDIGVHFLHPVALEASLELELLLAAA
jgi:hypothetical protein